MKKSLKLIVLALILASCGKPQVENSGNTDSLKAVNQSVYNKAMDVHDAVMPKLDSIIILKRNLKDALSSASITPEREKEFNDKTQLLDSAYSSMMDWMHDPKLRPPQDTTDQKVYQKYIEAKLESAMSMKALILEAIEKGTR